jgi:rhodanese-related sulfurtransferase
MFTRGPGERTQVFRSAIRAKRHQVRSEPRGSGVKGRLDTIDLDGYLTVVKNPNGALLLDVRDENELVSGRVPGTINVSRGRLEFRIWKLLGHPDKVDMNRKIYVQCSSGGRATLAAKQLKDIGFTNENLGNINFTDARLALPQCGLARALPGIARVSCSSEPPTRRLRGFSSFKTSERNAK